MRTFFTNGMALMIAAGCLVPAGASASTIFSFSEGGPTTGSYASGVTTISFNTLSINGTTITSSGTFTETYTNSTGVLTISGGTGSGALDGTLITIQDGTTYPTVADSKTLNLYSAATSITLNNSAFATDLGLTGTTTILPSSVISENFGITTSATGSVTSTQATMTLPTATPEPSTFAMLGLLLIAAGFTPARRKLNFLKLAK